LGINKILKIRKHKKMEEIIDDVEVFFNDVPDEDLNKELQKSMDDIKAGRVISFSDFKEKLKNKYNI
jgi:hypothetical protein